MKNKGRNRFEKPEYLNKMVDDFWNAVIIHDLLEGRTNYFNQFSREHTEKEQTRLAIQHAKEVDDLILKALRCPNSEARKRLLSSQTPLMQALLVHRCNTVVQTMDDLDQAGLAGFVWPEFAAMAYCLLILTRAPHEQVGRPAAIPDKECPT
ncbi:hypothetical protein [Anaeromusa acidaminophila]|uniref:hypothetical protein n=1 Tax=Anaeromusa acidaminophila TaxID=81464 RepID=UPI000360A1CE|nr:hypothetical protein [Anaeromusa acidaminophila]